MIKQIFQFIFGLAIILLILSTVVIAFYLTAPTIETNEKVDCFDRYGHKINGLECDKKISIVEAIFTTVGTDGEWNKSK